MSSIIRSAVILAALVGSVSAASAHGWSHSSGKHHAYGYSHGKRWVKVDGKWTKHDARAFFDKLQKHGN